MVTLTIKNQKTCVFFHYDLFETNYFLREVFLTSSEFCILPWKYTCLKIHNNFKYHVWNDNP